ncbi:MAG: GNAT family N-acetyltransferase, partial [Spirochaetes bacterium]|nr:GNAT family N-acetyltransferase [Spirochaetota bacterium]
MAVELKTLNADNINEITKLFFDVFSKEPWNDDWSDENQLNAYILDLTGNNNSLTLGFCENGVMIGLSMGRVKHWFSGTEYCIDEFCIKTEEQGRGLGRQFIEAVESFIKQKG